MTRFLIPIILIAIAVVGLFTFTNPIYNDIGALKAQTADYNQALDNSKALENERDKLTGKYNSISHQDLDKLQKLLPDNVDNIRLILEIEGIAAPYGMALKNVKYDNSTNQKTTSDSGAGSATPIGAPAGAPAVSSSFTSGGDGQTGDYGTWNLEFGVTGSYSNFLSFIRDLEHNLRIVDISSVSFSSDNSDQKNPDPLSQVYTYDIKIKTYWLRN